MVYIKEILPSFQQRMWGTINSKSWRNKTPAVLISPVVMEKSLP